ncbi:strawberry notch-like NTP hydrolase domain-containing protein [Vibrio harveyi]|uniref:strawberry notch-like NTP hydrolase domain-containing protein n=1 Tax=Vibrio harveyi TaxID=669 RepID=UPI003BB6E569|nr:strawberry notch family protein [Vibrio harveyi]
MAKTTPWLDATHYSVNLAPFSPKGSDKTVLLLYGNISPSQKKQLKQEAGFRDLTYQVNPPNQNITILGMPFPLNASGFPDPRKVEFDKLLEIFPEASLKEMGPKDIASHWKKMLTNQTRNSIYEVANSKRAIRLATTGELLGKNEKGQKVYTAQETRYIETPNGDIVVPKSLKSSLPNYLYFNFQSPYETQKAAELLLNSFLDSGNQLDVNFIHKWIEHSFDAPTKTSMRFAQVERDLLDRIQITLLAKIRQQVHDQHVSKESLTTANDIFNSLPFSDLAHKKLENPAVGHSAHIPFVVRHFLEYVDNVNDVELIGKDSLSLATMIPSAVNVSHVTTADDTLYGELSSFSQGENSINAISRDITTNFVSDASVLISMENDSAEIMPKAVSGIMINRKDHANALLTLAASKEDTPVMIVVNSDSPTAPGQISRESESFHNHVFQNYLISGMVEVSGNISGSNLPQAHKRIYFSNGRRLEATKASAPTTIPVLESLDELYEFSKNLKSNLAEVQRATITNEAAQTSTSISELLGHFEDTQSETTQLEVNKLQRRYTPMTNLVSGSNSVIPVNFVGSQAEAYKKIIRDIGNPDKFILDQLGMSKEHLTGVLDAGQIDGVTMAVWNAIKKRPFILADDAGNGKGRIIASVLYWSIKNGQTPVFVTKNTDLISDIIRDFRDIGVLDQIEPLIISGSDVVEKDTGVVYRDKNTIRKELDSLNLSAKDTAGGLDYLPLNKAKKKYNIVLTAYSQLSTVNKRALRELPKRGRVTKRSENFIVPLPYNALDNRAKLVMDVLMQSKLPVAVIDESHVGAGQDSYASQVVQNIIQSTQDRGMLLRSSATWAKHATNAATCTDVLRGAFTQLELREMLASGGTQVQEAFATVLAANGSLIKRDHDMGRRKAETVEATEYLPRNRRITDTFAEILTLAKDFNRLQKTAYYKHKKITDTAESANRVSFTSPLHLIQDGLNVAMVADFAVDSALEYLKDGLKPIFSVENTNATALEFMVERLQEEFIEANPNTPLPEEIILDEEPSFKIALHRWLQREQSVTIERPYTAQEIADAAQRGEAIGPNDKKKEIVSWKNTLPSTHSDYIALEQLNREIESKIETLPFIPLSSMDYITRKLKEQGWDGWEISGRAISVQKTENGQFKIVNGQVSDNARAQIDFQQDKLDFMFLTRSGTTGISLHSDAKLARFGDKALRARKLVALTPFQDIADEEQWANRAERKNQVVPSSITRLSTGLPAVARKFAMIENHRKSLSSLKSGSAESQKQMDCVDFVNHFGDLQMVYFLEENPHFVDTLELPQKYSELLKDGTKSLNPDSRSRYDSFVLTVLGQLYYLKCSEQEAFLDAFTRFYNAAYSLEKAQGRDPVNSAFIHATFKVNNVVQISGVSKPVYENELDRPVTAEVVELKYAPSKVDLDALQETVNSSLHRNKTWLSNDGTLSKFRLKYDNPKFVNEYLQKLLDASISKGGIISVPEGTTLDEALNGTKPVATIVAQKNWLQKGFKYVNSIVVGGVYNSPINLGDQYVVLDVNVKEPTIESNISIADAWYITTVNTVTNAVDQKSLRDFERIFREPELLSEYYDGQYNIDHEVADKLRKNSEQGRTEKRIILRGNLLEAARINANEKVGQMVTFIDDKGKATQCLLTEPTFSLTKLLRKEHKVSKAALNAVTTVLEKDLVKSKQISLVHSTYDPKKNADVIISITTQANRDDFVLTLPKNKTPRKGVSEDSFINSKIPIALHKTDSQVFHFKRCHAADVLALMSSYGFNVELTMQDAMELEKLVSEMEQSELALSSLLAQKGDTSTPTLEDAIFTAQDTPQGPTETDGLADFSVPEKVELPRDEPAAATTVQPEVDPFDIKGYDTTTTQPSSDTNTVDLTEKNQSPIVESESQSSSAFDMTGFETSITSSQESSDSVSPASPREASQEPAMPEHVSNAFSTDGFDTTVKSSLDDGDLSSTSTKTPNDIVDDPFASVLDELEDDFDMNTQQPTFRMN